MGGAVGGSPPDGAPGWSGVGRRGALVGAAVARALPRHSGRHVPMRHSRPLATEAPQGAPAPFRVPAPGAPAASAGRRTHGSGSRRGPRAAYTGSGEAVRRRRACAGADARGHFPASHRLDRRSVLTGQAGCRPCPTALLSSLRAIPAAPALAPSVGTGPSAQQDVLGGGGGGPRPRGPPVVGGGGAGRRAHALEPAESPFGENGGTNIGAHPARAGRVLFARARQLTS